MAKRQSTGPMRPQRPLQPNAAQYQQGQVARGNPGEPPSTWQNPQNALAAREFERRFNPAVGTSGAAVGSPESALSNPPGVGALPTGATGLSPRPKGKGK